MTIVISESDLIILVRLSKVCVTRGPHVPRIAGKTHAPFSLPKIFLLGKTINYVVALLLQAHC